MSESLILTIDARRIEAEVERQSVAWEVSAYRVLAGVVALAVAMLVALSPSIGAELAVPTSLLGVVVVLYCLLGAAVLRRRLAAVSVVRTIGAAFEASCATLALLIVLRVRGPEWAATSPVTLIYPLAIVASTMRMRHWLTVMVAGLAVVEYLAVYFLLIWPALDEAARQLAPVRPWAALERAFWIAGIGGLAAFATVKIKGAAAAGVVQRQKRKHVAQELSRFVSADVAEQVLRGRVGLGRAQRRHVTVLFCDLRDFTGLCEREPPEAAMTLLNAFYERAHLILRAHGGHVNKFLGDGLLVLFGAPDEHPRHARAAIEAAQQLQVAAREMRAAGGTWSRLRIGIGIDTGDVVVGALGAPERMEYTAIGATVNRAARLQALAQGDRRIVVSGATAGAAGMDTGAELIELGEVKIKGMSEPTPVFTVA